MKQDTYRIEVKYVLCPLQLQQCDFWLRENGRDFVEKHNTRQISSIYFDTVNFKNYFENIAGLSLRGKYRLRWYGNDRTLCFLEHKQKTKRFNKKTIHQLTGENLNFQNLSKLHNSIMKQLSASARIEFMYYTTPNAFVSYKRKYYETKTGCRLTIDTEQRLQNLWQQKELSIQKNIINEAVVEIKYPNNINKEFISFLKTFPFRPFRNSKYINACNSHIDHY